MQTIQMLRAENVNVLEHW